MSTYPVHTIASAPEGSRASLEALQKTFGFVPNVAGAMATSPVLTGAFVEVFQRVHSGTFAEKEIQVLLLTNAVTNAAPWPVALHSALALQAGVDEADVAAIRARRLPADPRLSALSDLARSFIEHRGHVDPEVLARFEGTYRPELALEAILVIAASTITNYTASLTSPPLEPMLQKHAWTPPV